MSKTPRSARREVDDIRSEYEFDYSRAKPNPYASRLNQPVVAVVLESDVAAVFGSAAKVNAQLRSIMATKKHRRPTRARTQRRKQANPYQRSRRQVGRSSPSGRRSKKARDRKK